MSTSPFVIEDTNLSNAWRTVLERAINSPKMEISPLIITITEFNEAPHVRNVLNAHLLGKKLGTIETVSETIFPDSLYKLFDRDRFTLYETYLINLPRLKEIERRGNGRGTYFERLIAYEGRNNEKINQLEIIIKSLNGTNVKRRSKLQASIFDPSKDHINGMFQGFPCLQHITFYKSDSGGLVLNSFYAIQSLYRRGYGNWLGLINLGKFIANETGLEFERFNCFVGVEQIDKLGKGEAKKLLEMTS
jgi:thymidylate synthase